MISSIKEQEQVHKVFIQHDYSINYLECMERLRSENFSEETIFKFVAITGKVELLSQLDIIKLDIHQFLLLATVTSQSNSLEYLCQIGIDIQKPLPLATESTIVAAATGQLDTLVGMHKQGVDITEAVIVAAATGQLDTLVYMYKQGVDITEAVIGAAATGQLEILIYLNKQNVCIKNALVSATIAGQTKIIKYLHENNKILCELSSEHNARLEIINQEILRSDPIYRPSQFWQLLGEAQKSHLRFSGEKNFKRNINQSYCHFIPKALDDLLMVHLKNVHYPVNVNAVYVFKDPDNDPNLWFSFYEDYQIFTENRELKKNLYCEFISKIYEYALHSSYGSVLYGLEEPELGNPIRIFRNGKLISQDLVTSAMEYGLVSKHLNYLKLENPYVIGELGAGYGRLAYVFLKSTSCQYMIFDIPPALHIAEWYLSSLFPEKRIFKFRHFDNFKEIEQELALADIAFFTPNQLSMFRENFFNVFITISSLHEMSRKQIAHFINVMSIVTREVIYIKQYWEYINPHDNLRIIDSEYILPEKFRIIQKQQDVLNPLFFEMLAVNKIKEPTISILLSNYNHAEYLPDSLSAICEQTVPAFEVIIIDDGSTDNSVEIIESFKIKYSNIILLKNNKNKGLMYSINRVIEESKADYIVWAASDDRLLPNFIEKNLECMKLYPNVGVCFSRLAVFQDGTNIERHYTEKNYGAAFDLGENNVSYFSKETLIDRLQQSYLWMSGNTVVAKRSAILAMGGFKESLRWHTDWFTYYVVAIRYGVCIIPETLAMMRERPNTYSKNGMNNPIEQHQVLAAIIKTIYEQENRDIMNVFIKCPSLLSLFGYRILLALVEHLRYWRLFSRYLNWYVFYHQQYHKRLVSKIIKIIKKVLIKIIFREKII